MIQPVFASPYLNALLARAHQKNLSADPYWRRLLHDRRDLLGRYQSDIGDPSFFLSPNGRKDPSAELDATLEAFFITSSPAASGGGSTFAFHSQRSDGHRGSTHPPMVGSLPEAAGNDGREWQPAQCRFPARYAWLKEQLDFDPAELPEIPCPRFDQWKSQMNPAGLSLVFASYYMNNPASTYGHTFLRLNAKGHASTEHLLDYVVNFAADLASDNGALFAVKGLMGGYDGRFSTFPYYMKVQEYNNLESRDLWEYDLNVSTANIDRLLEHLWEMGNVRMPYFFFNKNCSYYLLPVLEVMDPRLSLSRRFVLKTVPMDTVRAVIDVPGMLKGVSYRPSYATKMVSARKRLSKNEVHLAEKLVDNVIPAAAGGNPSSPLTELPLARQALVLDSAYDLFRYRVGFKRDQPKEVQEKEQQLLLLRNQINPPSQPSPARGEGDYQPTSPDQGHKTGRMDLSYGFSNHSHFEEISIRPSLHDQDDPPAGYSPGSQLEMFHLKLRYDNDRQTAYVQEFPLVHLVSLTPWDRWIHPPSWKVETGLAVANDLNRDPENSLYYGLTLGSGYAAWAPGTEKLLFYGMAQTDVQLGHAFSHDVRFGGGPSGGILFNPCTYWRARFEMSQDFYAVGGTPSTTKLGFHQSVALTKEMELRASLERQNTYKEVLLSWVLFL